MPFYVNTQKPDSSREIARLLGKCIKRHKRDWTEIVFLCIGSDRVTGDCLGPYVGYRLSQHQLPGIFVYGTLNQPVHAVNLCIRDRSIRYNGLYFKEPSVCPCNCYRRVSRR